MSLNFYFFLTCFYFFLQRLHQISLKTNSARTSLVRRCNYHSERILSTIRDLNPELPKTLKENSEEMEGIITNKQVNFNYSNLLKKIIF